MDKIASRAFDRYVSRFDGADQRSLSAKENRSRLVFEQQMEKNKNLRAAVASSLERQAHGAPQNFQKAQSNVRDRYEFKDTSKKLHLQRLPVGEHFDRNNNYYKRFDPKNHEFAKSSRGTVYDDRYFTSSLKNTTPVEEYAFNNRKPVSVPTSYGRIVHDSPARKNRQEEIKWRAARTSPPIKSNYSVNPASTPSKPMPLSGKIALGVAFAVPAAAAAGTLAFLAKRRKKKEEAEAWKREEERIRKENLEIAKRKLREKKRGRRPYRGNRPPFPKPAYENTERNYDH